MLDAASGDEEKMNEEQEEVEHQNFKLLGLVKSIILLISRKNTVWIEENSL